MSTKAIIESISPIETAKSGTKFVNIVIRKPARMNEFGEKIGNDDIFNVQVYNNKIEEIPKLHKGDKIEIKMSLSGSEHLDQNSKIFYRMSLTEWAIEKLS